MESVKNREFVLINNPGYSIRLKVGLNLFFLALLILIDLTPFLDRNLHPIIQLGIFIMWFITSQGLPVFKEVIMPKEMMRWWWIYTFWIFFMSLIRHSNISPLHYIVTIHYYFIPYMMIVVLRSYNNREMKLLWKFIFIILIVNVIQNYIIGYNNPDVFRLRDNFENNENAFTNAGGTRFIVACFLIAPVFWLVMQETNNRKLKNAMIISVVLVVIYISLINNRATAAIILFVEIFLLILLRFVFKNMKSYVSIGIVLIVLFVVSFFFLEELLESAATIFGENERFSKRLEDMTSISQGVDIENLEEGSLSVRYFLWMLSLKTFVSSIPNFLFGVGVDVHEGDLFGLINYGVGCHSEFFDLAAQFGIVGIFVIYKFLRSIISFTWKLSISEKQRTILIVFWMGFIFYSFFNASFYSQAFYVIFIFLPTSLILVNNKLL